MMTQFKKTRELEIDSEAPWDDDVFKTLEGYATFLTNALIADPGPFVLNVNGAWGSGKTFFVKRWAADLRMQGYPVVEFNAWENDAEADPLTCLLAECISSLSEHLDKRTKVLQKLQEKGGRVAVSLGKIVTQAVMRRALGDDGAKDLKDLFSKETEQDLIALGGSLVEEQIRKKSERQAFVDELKNLVVKLREKEKGPVLIFIDELDRCRSTFAIELLERVKHLFNVDGIKFIVSTDSEQLVHSISGAYGTNFDSATYLQRFFDETFKLPDPTYAKFAEMLFAPVRELFPDLDELWLTHGTAEETFSTFAGCFGLSLRQQNQAFHRLIAVSANCGVTKGRKFHFIYSCFLIFLKFKNDKSYDALTRPDEKNSSLAIRASGTNRINELIGKYSMPTAYAKYLTTYTKIMEGDHDNAITIVNASRPEGPRRPGYREPEEIVHECILRECVHDFPAFKAYPRLIELTASIEKD